MTIQMNTAIALSDYEIDQQILNLMDAKIKFAENEIGDLMVERMRNVTALVNAKKMNDSILIEKLVHDADRLAVLLEQVHVRLAELKRSRRDVLQRISIATRCPSHRL